MSSALDKVMLAAGWGTGLEDGTTQLVLAAQVAVRELAALAKAETDDDNDGDEAEDNAQTGGGHSDHGTYKALIKKGVKPAMAAKMCARADKKAEMTALADSAAVILASLFERDAAGRVIALAAPAGESASERRQSAKEGNALPDGSYPIPDKKHLHSAAVLAASGHGDVSAAKALIRKRAKELGVDVTTLPGFGSENEKVAATMLALAAGKMTATPAVAHPPFHGVHSHAHVHSGDNMHGGTSDRMADGRGGY